jgi:preprotein translocase subunit SecD
MTYGVAKSALQQIPAADREKAMADTVATISNRVDKLGVKELTIRRIGDDEIVIEQPKMEDSEARAMPRADVGARHARVLLVALREPSGQAPEAKVLNVPTGQGDATRPYTFSGSAADAQRKTAYRNGQDPSGGKPYRDGKPYTLLMDRGGQSVELPVNDRSLSTSTTSRPLPPSSRS